MNFQSVFLWGSDLKRNKSVAFLGLQRLSPHLTFTKEKSWTCWRSSQRIVSKSRGWTHPAWSTWKKRFSEATSTSSETRFRLVAVETTKPQRVRIFSFDISYVYMENFREFHKFADFERNLGLKIAWALGTGGQMGKSIYRCWMSLSDKHSFYLWHFFHYIEKVCIYLACEWGGGHDWPYRWFLLYYVMKVALPAVLRYGHQMAAKQHFLGPRVSGYSEFCVFMFQ